MTQRLSHLLRLAARTRVPQEQTQAVANIYRPCIRGRNLGQNSRWPPDGSNMSTKEQRLPTPRQEAPSPRTVLAPTLRPFSLSVLLQSSRVAGQEACKVGASRTETNHSGTQRSLHWVVRALASARRTPGLCLRSARPSSWAHDGPYRTQSLRTVHVSHAGGGLPASSPRCRPGQSAECQLKSALSRPGGCRAMSVRQSGQWRPSSGGALL
jgi:hypothetical protein